MVDNLKQGSSDQELKNSLQKFEEKLTEIKELESIRRAKEIVAQVKVMRNRQSLDYKRI
mgnify:CR=1 FL=1